MDSRIAGARFVCKLNELEEALQRLQDEKVIASQLLQDAQQDKREAKQALATACKDHKASLACCQTEHAALQAQMEAGAKQNHALQAQINQHASELAAVLEQRTQTHQKLKASTLNATLQSCHHDVQQQLQAKQNECSALHKQLKGQKQLMDTIEEEVNAVRREFAGIQTAVAKNEAHVADHQSWVQKIVIRESRMIGELEIHSKKATKLQQQNSELRKQTLLDQEALKTVSAELEIREQKIVVLQENLQCSNDSHKQVTERHTGLLDQLQASNDLVQSLSSTCKVQLQALDKLRQNMSARHAANTQGHDEQKHALTTMRQSEAELLQQVQVLQQRSTAFDKQAQQSRSSGRQCVHQATQTVQDQPVALDTSVSIANPALPAPANLCLQPKSPDKPHQHHESGQTTDGKPVASIQQPVLASHNSECTACPEAANPMSTEESTCAVPARPKADDYMAPAKQHSPLGMEASGTCKDAEVSSKPVTGGQEHKSHQLEADAKGSISPPDVPLQPGILLNCHEGSAPGAASTLSPTPLSGTMANNSMLVMKPSGPGYIADGPSELLLSRQTPLTPSWPCSALKHPTSTVLTTPAAAVNMVHAASTTMFTPTTQPAAAPLNCELPLAQAADPAPQQQLSAKFSHSKSIAAHAVHIVANKAEGREGKPADDISAADDMSELELDTDTATDMLVTTQATSFSAAAASQSRAHMLKCPPADDLLGLTIPAVPPFKKQKTGGLPACGPCFHQGLAEKDSSQQQGEYAMISSTQPESAASLVRLSSLCNVPGSRKATHACASSPPMPVTVTGTDGQHLLHSSPGTSLPKLVQTVRGGMTARLLNATSTSAVPGLPSSGALAISLNIPATLAASQQTASLQAGTAAGMLHSSKQKLPVLLQADTAAAQEMSPISTPSDSSMPVDQARLSIVGQPHHDVTHARLVPPGHVQKPAQSPVSLFSSKVVALKAGSTGTHTTSHTFDRVLITEQRASSISKYKPIIEEVPCEPVHLHGSGAEHAAEAVLPTPPTKMFDTDGDDDCAPNAKAPTDKARMDTQHTRDAGLQQRKAGTESQPPAELLSGAADNGRQTEQLGGMHDRCSMLAQAHHPQATNHASTTKQAAASAMGDIFSSFSAFDDMSDGEDEDEPPSATTSTMDAHAGRQAATAARVTTSQVSSKLSTAKLAGGAKGVSTESTELIATNCEQGAVTVMPGSVSLLDKSLSHLANCCPKCSDPDFGYMPQCVSCSAKYHASCLSGPIPGSSFKCQQCMRLAVDSIQKVAGKGKFNARQSKKHSK